MGVIEEIFGPEGLIARASQGFAYRRGQEMMAAGVSKALVEGSNLIVQAGTGTGKSLAYLIPAVLVALGRNERIVISTGTKALQEQIVDKDIPFVREILNVKFTAQSIKGRSNYVCLHRLAEATAQPQLSADWHGHDFERVRAWSARTLTGDRAELKGLPDALSFWSAIDARSETCLGKECPKYDKCFITQLKKRADEAQILVVNHHLLLADLAVRAQMPTARVLPDHGSLVIDEAHMIEDIACEYFGRSVSTLRLKDIVRDLMDFGAGAVERRFIDAVKKMESALSEVWRSFPHEEYGQLRLALESLTGDELFVKAEAAIDEMESVEEALTTFAERGLSDARGLNRRLAAVRKDLEFITRGGDEFNVCWVEQRGRFLALRATPIDVSYALRKHVFERLRSVVLTSATLRTAGGFAYIRRRFGMDKGDEMVVDSPFNYNRQAVLYLPPDMPAPSSGGWLAAATDRIVRLLEITGGPAFILTTTVGGMRRLREMVSQRVAHTCLMQGELGTQELISTFRKTPNAVLFATGSFWQGVDVRGLSLVVIDKLPFAVPDDPVVAARHKYIARKGGNGFRDLTVPQATIALSQGIGRLIRCESDSGVLSILDPRLQSESYGRLILRSLPRIPQTSDIEEVSRRFKQMRGAAAIGPAESSKRRDSGRARVS